MYFNVHVPCANFIGIILENLQNRNEDRRGAVVDVEV
jgi:hypothetical protein